MGAPGTDPALAAPIPTPAEWWGAHRTLLGAAGAWVAVAVVTLLALWDVTPPLWALPLLLLLVGAGVGLILLLLPKLRGSLQELGAMVAARRATRAALACLAAGDPEGAEAAWRPLLDRRLPPTVHAVVVHNLGVSALAAGAVHRAQARMEHAWRSGWFDRLSLRARRPAALQAQALVAAILSDPTGAHARLAEARVGAVPQALRPYLTLAEALTALRDGQPAAAAAHADRIDLDALPAPGRATAALVQAFAHTLDGRPAAGPIPGLRADHPRWAAAHWPELAAFAAERVDPEA